MVAVCAVVVSGCGGSTTAHSTSASASPSADTPQALSTQSTRPLPAAVKPVPAHRPRRPAQPPFAVGERTVTFIDRSRTVSFPGAGPAPRRLVTLIRYPATGPASRTDIAGAPARSGGPFPLVIFGHGFAVTPGPYAQLLQTWARAGYVVAAPIFPLENATAPGGPNESDLVHQPRDMSVVITRMLAASADPHSVFAGLIDPHRIAVSGQSDGGETALAVAYDRHYVDRRVRAAVILSGAEIPGVGGFAFPAPSPPLLATQGTADTINPPSFTYAFFDLAPSPKYLLRMFGAPHLPPYTDLEPELGIVERVTIAFLDRYLKGLPGALHRMIRAGDVPGISALTARS